MRGFLYGLTRCEAGRELLLVLLPSLLLGFIVFIVVLISVNLSHNKAVKEEFGGDEKCAKSCLWLAGGVAIMDFILGLIGLEFLTWVALILLGVILHKCRMSKPQATVTVGVIIAICLAIIGMAS